MWKYLVSGNLGIKHLQTQILLVLVLFGVRAIRYYVTFFHSVLSLLLLDKNCPGWKRP